MRNLKAYLKTGIAVCFNVLLLCHAHAKDKPASKANFGFIENKGQVTDQYGQPRKDIDYKLEAGGVVLFAGKGQLHYQWYRESGNTKPEILNSKKGANTKTQTEGYRMDVELVGANVNAEAVAEDMQPYHENYYGQGTGEGILARSYSRVVYKNVYPYIDWVLYVNEKEGKLKYDFVVHAGGNPAHIKLQYKGATALALQDGALVVSTPMGSITEEAPYSYNAATGHKINSAYTLQGNVLGYAVQAEGHKQGIVIDPNLKWASYYGTNTSDEIFYTLSADTAGNVHIIGNTSATSNIATTGVYQTSFTSISTSFIAKLDITGQRVWGTYMTANNASVNDNFISIAVDPAGNVYTVGKTNVSGQSSPGAYQANINGGFDVLIVKLDNTGNRAWATYYGGSADENSCAVFYDSVNNFVYVSGNTSSSNNMTSGGAAFGSLPTKGGFVAKFNAGTGMRSWGSYFPAIYILGMATDRTGNLYLTGFDVDNALTVLATPGAYQPAPASGAPDQSFVSKMNTTGGYVWGTYYGGTLPDRFNCIALDANGNVYVGGSVQSSGLASSTPPVHQSTCLGGQDGLLAKFSSSGVRQWATYYGGTSSEVINGIAITRKNNIIISGNSFSNNGIATGDALQGTNAGPWDMFFAIFNDAGVRQYGTYYGGTASDRTTGDYIPGHTNDYVKGRLYSGCWSWSTNLGTGGTYRPNHPVSDQDAFVAVFTIDTFVTIKQPFADTVLCPGDTLQIPYYVNENFRNTNTFVFELSNTAGSFAAPTVLGSVAAQGNGTFKYRLPYTQTPGTGYRVRVRANAPFDTAYEITNIRIKPTANNVIASSNTPACVDDTIRLFGSSSTGGVTWAWTGPGSYSTNTQNAKRGAVTAAMAGDYILAVTLGTCTVLDTETVVVNPLPAKPTAGSNTPLCYGATLNLTATTTTPGVTWSWTGPTGFSSALQNPSRTGLTALDGGNYIVSATLNGCSTKDTEAVVVYTSVPSLVANNTGPYCVGSNVYLVTTTVAGANYTWSGPGGYTSSVQNPVINSTPLSASGVYTVYATVNGCNSATASTTVNILSGPTVNIYPSPNDTICAGAIATFTALPVGAGASPGYQWLKNGTPISGATGISYPISGLIDGDEVSFLLTPGTGAGCTTPVNSNKIKMSVVQYQTPIVTITASDTNAWPGLLINFTAAPANGGVAPKYQWKVNNTNVVGATSNIWGTTQLNNNDVVCVEMKPDYLCPSPATASACQKIHIATGIDKTAGNTKLNIYPNPANDVLHIEGISKGTRIQLFDVMGREVYNASAAQAHEQVNTGKLQAGNYMLQLTDAAGERVSVKIVISK